MVQQAEEFADQDRARAASVQSRNQAESLTYEAERLLEENKAKIAEADAADVRAKVDELRTALQGKDEGAVHLASEALTKALHKIAQEMYRTAGAQGGSPGAPSAPDETSDTEPPAGHSAPGSSTGPVDADFKVVDDGTEPGPSYGGGPLNRPASVDRARPRCTPPRDGSAGCRWPARGHGRPSRPCGPPRT